MKTYKDIKEKIWNNILERNKNYSPFDRLERIAMEIVFDEFEKYLIKEGIIKE